MPEPTLAARSADVAASIFASLGLGPNGEVTAAPIRGAPVPPTIAAATAPPAVAYSSSLTRGAPPTARVYYKAVAVLPSLNGDGASFLSIYDGVTQYRIGVDLYQRMNEGDFKETCGGFFCFEVRLRNRDNRTGCGCTDPRGLPPQSAEQVFNAIVPSNSALKTAERAVLKCLGWGTRRRFPNGKYCVERLRPVGIFPFPRDAIPDLPPRRFDTDTRLGPDVGGSGGQARLAHPSRLQAENFTLQEEVRQMEARLEVARNIRRMREHYATA